MVGKQGSQSCENESQSCSVEESSSESAFASDEGNDGAKESSPAEQGHKKHKHLSNSLKAADGAGFHDFIMPECFDTPRLTDVLDEAVLGAFRPKPTEVKFGNHRTYTDLNILTPAKRKRKIYTQRQLEYHDRVTEFNDAINAMTILI